MDVEPVRERVVDGWWWSWAWVSGLTWWWCYGKRWSRVHGRDETGRARQSRLGGSRAIVRVGV